MTMQPTRRNLPLRALPARAYVPGRTPRPDAKSEPEASNETRTDPICLPESRWAEQTEYLWGLDLYNAGYFWEAHEAWEALWRVAALGGPQRELLQALIQCAAAALKQSIGEAAAARRLALRALHHLTKVGVQPASPYMGLDLALLGSALRTFSEMDGDAAPPPTPPRLDVRPI